MTTPDTTWFLGLSSVITALTGLVKAVLPAFRPKTPKRTERPAKDD